MTWDAKRAHVFWTADYRVVIPQTIEQGFSFFFFAKSQSQF